jgi:hypothetical protein
MFCCLDAFALQERASLVQGQLPTFLAGQLPDAGDSGKNKKELMQQVQEFIAGWQQVSGCAVVLTGFPFRLQHQQQQ